MSGHALPYQQRHDRTVDYAHGIVARVTISITAFGNGSYSALVTPPHSEADWRSWERMTARELVDQLRGLGCHATDIGDAFYAANPDWLVDTE